MKKSNQVVGLPIISIQSGTEIGHVKSLVINSADKSIDFLTVDHPDWDVSVKAVPFRKVIGVGEYAVMIEEEKGIFDLSEIPIANELVKKKISIIGTKIIDRGGQFHGEVNEFFLDDHTGRILGLQFKNGDAEHFLSIEHVITLGKDLLIVSVDAFEQTVTQPEAFLSNHDQQQNEAQLKKEPEKSMKEARVIESEQLSSYAQVSNTDESSDFKEKQVEILEGKKLLKDIYAPDGNLLFEKGSILNRKEIEKAQNTGVGVVVELSMHVSQ
ncbi:PRC-barrel domain-containing protein [Alkalihalobacillus macyae]|uniref:PRC-barrel domain-containing protein n=1 Tax=Guptibacillus hwajinpoensis TaxID=208199 RepID=UPI00273C5185|nr:PRC-barrel domain-containing protein [Alkalihalobacillus macyae]MDP4550468.1 PRC-barrel domain-containing protein [Alkalihalobacillus macyae]